MAIGLAALGLAGCGANTGANSRTSPAAFDAGGGYRPPISSPKSWTEQQVLEAAGLRASDTGTGYETGSGCRVSVVMTDAPTVDRYVEAGDVVVTNPDGTAGVKMRGDDPECPYELDKGLAKLYRP